MLFLFKGQIYKWRKENPLTHGFRQLYRRWSGFASQCRKLYRVGQWYLPCNRRDNFSGISIQLFRLVLGVAPIQSLLFVHRCKQRHSRAHLHLKFAEFFQWFWFYYGNQLPLHEFYLISHLDHYFVPLLPSGSWAGIRCHEIFQIHSDVWTKRVNSK